MASVGTIKAGEAFVEIGADLSQLSKGLRRAEGMLKSAGARMRRAGMGIFAVGAAAAAGLGAAAKQAGNLESQVRDLERVTSREIAEGIADSVRRMAKVIPVGTTELMRLAQTAGSLGINGKKNIETFIEVAAQMGTATRVSAEESGQALGKMSNAFNIPIKQAKNMGSVIAGLAKENAAWGDEITSAMLKSAAAAGQLDMKFSDLAAIEATLISAGMESSRAGTLMNTTLTRMAAEADKVADALDIPVEQFQALIDEDPTAALRLIAQEMGKIESNAKKMEIAKEMFGVRSGKILGMFVNSLDSVNENLAIASDLYSEGSELQRQYSVVTKSFNSQMTLLWNNVKEVGLIIGTTLLPALSRIGQFLTGVMQIIQRFVKRNREWAKVLAVTAVGLMAVGGGLMAVGMAATVVGIALGGLASTLTLVGGAFVALAGVATSALTFLLSPIGLVIAAVAGLATLIWLNIDTVKSWVSSIGSAFSIAADWAKQFGKVITTAIHGRLKSVLGAVESFANTFKSIFPWFGDALASTFGSAWEMASGFFDKAANMLSSFFKYALEQARGFFATTAGWASKLAAGISRDIKVMLTALDIMDAFDVSPWRGFEAPDFEGIVEEIKDLSFKDMELPDIPEIPGMGGIGDITGQMASAAIGMEATGTFSAFGQGRTGGVTSRLDEQTDIARQQLSEQRQMRESLEKGTTVTR